jgi:hypothetical protein
MALVDAHIRDCERCLRLVIELRESLYSPNAPHARTHVKKQLFNIVAFDRDFGSVVRTARFVDAIRWVLALVLFVVGSALASTYLWQGYDTRSQLSLASVQTPQIIDSRSGRIAEFMAREGIVTVRFNRDSVLNHGALSGYIHPTSSGVLFVGRDIPLAPPLTVYVAWLKGNDQIIRIGTLETDEDGNVWLYNEDLSWCDGCTVEVSQEFASHAELPVGPRVFHLVYSK